MSKIRGSEHNWTTCPVKELPELKYALPSPVIEPAIGKPKPPAFNLEDLQIEIEFGQKEKDL